MELQLNRIAKKDTYTIGKLYIDGVYFCDTLEDKDRGLKDSMSVSEIQKLKVYGETAIPIGTYTITITYSSKFRKMLPLIHNVKGFSGIRIHSGNTEKDTLGCIIVGQNKVKGKVINSIDTFNKLFTKLKTSNNIKLTIK